MSRATAFVFVLLVFASGALSAGAAAAEEAKGKPCWKRVHDDWYEDGRIDGVYSARCIDEALKRLPEDVRAYSNFESRAKEARQDAFRRIQGAGPSDREAPPPGAGGVREVEPRAGVSDEGPFTNALGRLGPDDSDSVPLPLLVLAALAATLILAGAAGLARRRLRARRAAAP
jgi:hypothetical protein